MSTLDYHRKYAWDWLAILLLMVVLVITEELKPFEKSIYNETDQVSSNSVFLRCLPRCMTVSVTSSMKLVVTQDTQAEPPNSRTHVWRKQSITLSKVKSLTSW